MREPILEPDVWERLRSILSERVSWGRRIVLHVDPENNVKRVEAWRVDSDKPERIDNAPNCRVTR